MPSVAVDPATLSAAGSAVVAAGDGLAAAMAVLTAGFGANTGLDAAGTVFGLAYQSAGESLLKAAATVINACRCNGARIQVSASNYSNAEAASTLGGGSSALQPPREPVKIAPPGPPGTLGPGEPPPLVWAFVHSFVDDVWPNGDVAALRAAAGCWRSFAATVDGMQNALNASKTLVDTQQIPEGEQINQVLSRIVSGIEDFGQECGKIASSLDDFANEVANAQNAIRDLLHRLESLCDLWHDVVSIFDGDALDEIKHIADDFNAIMHNLGREARALEHSLTLGMQVIDGLVVGMEKDTRAMFTHFLGDQVGDPVATVFDTVVNANEGVLKDTVGMAQGIMDLDPRWFLIDPKGAADTWMGMTKTGVINSLINPQEAGKANIQMFKSLLHLDDWRSDRPGLGAAENVFDVATFFLPGVGEAGAGAKGAGAAARGAEAGGEVADAAGAAGRAGTTAGELGELAGAGSALGDIGRAGSGLAKDFEGLTGDLPKPDSQLGGRPAGAPPPKPMEAPVEPTPRPTESAPPGTPPPESPTTRNGAVPGRPDAPAGPRERVPLPTVGSHPMTELVATGERVPSTIPGLAEHSSAGVPVSPSGSQVEPIPAEVHSPQPAPTLPSSASNASAPHFTPPAGGPPEFPPAGSGGWHGPDDGSPPGDRLHGAPPHGDGPHGHGHAASKDADPQGPDDGSSGGHRPGPQDDADEHLDRGSPDPENHPGKPMAGHDFPLPPDQALEILSDPGAEVARLTEGKVPEYILENYDPLAVRTSAEFEHEFTIRGEDGKLRWDWETQAPNNGFAGSPEISDRIPAELRLDRIGPNGGAFMSIEGSPLAERATPPGLASQYHTMAGSGERVPDGWIVLHGPAKAAFGQPGGAEQWVVIDELTKNTVPVEILDRAGTITGLRP